MSRYEALAGCYDALTEDVSYTRRADFIEKLMGRSRIPVKTVLDLACGTGTMTALLTRRGYELIAVDGSADMLAVAREKAEGLSGVPPLFLQQEMAGKCVDLQGCQSVFGHREPPCLISYRYCTGPEKHTRPTAAAAAVGLVVSVP